MRAVARTAEPPQATASDREFGSFRDPSGFLFWRDGEIYRLVDDCYAPQFEAATTSGLFDKAIAAGLMLPFATLDADAIEHGGADRGAIAILKPKQLRAISYPYEWSFTQLQDAALATLDLHLLAIEHGMILKDASAYNIQFDEGRPSHIDHLSFDSLSDHTAWPAYGQFCRHFLAPLLLMSYVGLSLGRLLQIHIDGVPLDLASAMLPARTKFNPAIQMHLHLHARMAQKYSDAKGAGKAAAKPLSQSASRAIATSLRGLIARLQPNDQSTEWGDYYAATNYSDTSFDAKKRLVRDFVQRADPKILWDIGGNNGEFSHAIDDLADHILCMDIDPRAVDQNYRRCRHEGVTNILPIVADLTNPAPGVGFANRERPALFERGRPDAIMALALIHHLAITNNLPLTHIAEFLGDHTNTLIVEFVPKSDSQVKRLLASRKDIFPDYTEGGFKSAFSQVFRFDAAAPIPESDRTLFLMTRR